MATALDERPKPRQPIVFGRALVAQQQAQAAAGEKAREDARKEANDQAMEKHRQLADQIAKAKLELEIEKSNVAQEKQLHDLTLEKQQLDAFKSAQEKIGSLKPNDPLLSEKIAKIQADHNVLFDGKANPMTQALSSQVSDLFGRRKALEQSQNKINETMQKSAGDADMQKAVIAAGLVPKSAKVGDVTYGLPADKTQQELHQKQQLYLQDYHAVEKERAGLKYDPKATPDNPGKAADPSVVKMLDARRVQALKNLSSVGINLDPNAPVQPSSSGAPTPTDSTDEMLPDQVDPMFPAPQVTDTTAAAAPVRKYNPESGALE